MRYRQWAFAAFVFLLSMAVFQSTARAENNLTISSYHVELEVDQSKEHVKETIDIFFTAAADAIAFIIPEDAQHLSVILDGTLIQCTTERAEKEGVVKLVCPLNKETRKRFITATYETAYSLIPLTDKKLMLRYRYTPLSQAEILDISVKLPEGYVIEDTARFITPEPDTLFSDGRRIIVGWERRNIETSFGISVIMSPLQTSSMSLVYFFLGVLGAGTLLFSMRRHSSFFLKKRITHLPPDRQIPPLRELVYPDLLESEEKIVEALQANLGVLKQKDLVNITGFSKAKMSRLVKQMESRNIIRSKPYGNSKKICLVTEKEKKQLSVQDGGEEKRNHTHQTAVEEKTKLEESS